MFYLSTTNFEQIIMVLCKKLCICNYKERLYIAHVLERLNSFHLNILFTYELENQSNIYLNWSSFAPVTWKRGTLNTLFNRAYIVCSTGYHLKKELDHLIYVFQKHNKTILMKPPP